MLFCVNKNKLNEFERNGMEKPSLYSYKFFLTKKKHKFVYTNTLNCSYAGSNFPGHTLAGVCCVYSVHCSACVHFSLFSTPISWKSLFSYFSPFLFLFLSFFLLFVFYVRSFVFISVFSVVVVYNAT